MNKKAIWIILGIVVVLAIAFFIMNGPETPTDVEDNIEDTDTTQTDRNVEDVPAEDEVKDLTADDQLLEGIDEAFELLE